ncbi:MAG: hypothetical protein J6Y37_12385 [Paludibacteraceae bacterium]|nr:hypothetical protein [Paludibacteraceae bacterium]
MVPKYDVEIEYLDKDGNVFDSHTVFMSDDYDEAYAESQKVELKGSDEQVSIWEWDDDRNFVEDSWVVKSYEE